MAPLLARNTAVDRAFERLYRLHALDVYRYALGMLRNQADAEDVTQTTFLNAYRALERGEEPELPDRWLIAIAHNVCRQRFRQQLRRVREVGLDVDVADQLVQREADENAATPEDIRRALGHLAFNQRSALVMRELEGRSYKEIAGLLNLSVSAVETLIFRARRALREQLEASWTCEQAEQALSKQLDVQLSRDERGQLRAHLRECAACRRIARSQRAQRSALRAALNAAHLPSSLAGLLGGGGATATVSVAAKAAAVVVAAGIAGGVGYQELNPPAPEQPKPAATAPARKQGPRIPIAAVLVPTRAPARTRRAAAPRPAAPVTPKRLPPTPATTTVAPDEPAAAAADPGQPDDGAKGRGRGTPAPDPVNDPNPATPPTRPERPNRHERAALLPVPPVALPEPPRPVDPPVVTPPPLPDPPPLPKLP